MESIGTAERIGFRFMLLAWIGALLIAFVACYFSYEAGRAGTAAASKAQELWKCEHDAMPAISSCHQVGGDTQCRVALDSACGTTRQQFWIDQAFERRNGLEEKTESLMLAALALLLISTVLFYGIRWGISGKLRPLWMRDALRSGR